MRNTGLRNPVLNSVIALAICLAGFVDRAGLGLFLFALFLQPLVGLLAGRTWEQLEVFGLAPDPTASATLGAVLCFGGRVRWELLVLPLAWCLVAGATAWGMRSPDAPLMPVLGLLALVLAAVKARSRSAMASRG